MKSETSTKQNKTLNIIIEPAFTFVYESINKTIIYIPTIYLYSKSPIYDVSWAAQTGQDFCGHKMLLIKIRNNFCVPGT